MVERIKDSQLSASINQKLVESGERERLKELLRTKLIECGWRDKLRSHCKDVIKQKGLENVTVDDLVAEITPKGRALVPDEVKREMLIRIRTFLAANS
ncbi:transcription and mRNA export factor ENY2-like [Stylophora pistillata]|uniref:transcription and mRNA export factor ENY2-like n=1 Tax=Stylophora pistillata TaxID=50429 RepID=UPI000C0396CE|nr:transcription and mRNA export factor ENY2-like [Stylophora pistillata]